MKRETIAKVVLFVGISLIPLGIAVKTSPDVASFGTVLIALGGFFLIVSAAYVKKKR